MPGLLSSTNCVYSWTASRWAEHFYNYVKIEEYEQMDFRCMYENSSSLPVTLVAIEFVATTPIAYRSCGPVKKCCLFEFHQSSDQPQVKWKGLDCVRMSLTSKPGFTGAGLDVKSACIVTKLRLAR